MEGTTFDPSGVVQRWLDAYAAGDWEAAYGLLSDDVEIEIMGVATLASGIDAVRAMDERILSGAQYRAEVRTIATTGDTAVVERVDHLVRGSEELHIPVCGVFQCDGTGKIASIREYFDTAAAAALLGSA